MTDVTDLNSKYLEIIPKMNPTNIQALLHEYQVDNEIKLLNSLFSISYSIRCMLGAYLNQATINPYDYILGTLGVNLSVIDPNSEETNLILHYLNSDSIHGYNLRNIIRVDDVEYSEKQEDKFIETPNHMMLWHGTSANNVLNIIKKGLRVAPPEVDQHGSRFGKGLYFSDSFTLSS